MSLEDLQAALTAKADQIAAMRRSEIGTMVRAYRELLADGDDPMVALAMVFDATMQTLRPGQVAQLLAVSMLAEPPSAQEVASC